MTSQRDSNSSGPERTITLNICTEEEKREMMREMLVEFVRVVDPREDGLLDTLYASYMLTETDNESLSGKDVLNRKDQARKLWFILNEVQLEDFMTSVAPELCKMYPHIIPSRFVAHADVNVTPELTGYDCKYEADPVWESIFSTFCERTESEVQTLMDGLRELLRRYHVMIPGDDTLKEIVTVGLPCTCESPVSSPPVSASVPQRKVGSWLRKTRFSQNRSSATSTTIMPASTYSSCVTRKSSSNHHSPCHDAEYGFEATGAPGYAVTSTQAPTAEENHEPEDVYTEMNTLCRFLKSNYNRLSVLLFFLSLPVTLLSVLVYYISRDQSVMLVVLRVLFVPFVHVMKELHKDDELNDKLNDLLRSINQ